MGKLSNLPADILQDILIRLPTESILECKLVCKPWRNLVSNPSFSQIHLAHLNHHHDPGKLTFISSTPYLRYIQEHQQFLYIEYNEDDHDETPIPSIRKTSMNIPFEINSIIGSCNGLICLYAYRADQDQPAYYICNPITKEYVKLPRLNRVKGAGSYHVYSGFGYLRETNEYKVVRIDQLVFEPNFECVEVYTLGSGNGWRNIGDCRLSCSVRRLFRRRLFRRSRGIFVSGSLYWIRRHGNIVAFDLADEIFCEIPTLHCLSLTYNSSFVIKIWVSGGVLCCSICNKQSRRIDIWLLKRNGNQNMMEQEGHLSLFWGEAFAFTKPLALMKSGEVLLFRDDRLYFYDIKSSCSKMLVKFPRYVNQTIAHMNTLVSLKALGETDTKTMKQAESEISCEEKRIGIGRRSSHRQVSPHCLCAIQ